MPIYAYKCASCGYAKDVLQKISDPLLTVCPQCGKPAFEKQVTAAGFQLKGTGWYVTDFRSGGNGPSSAESPADKDGKTEAKPDQAQGESKPSQAKPDQAKPESKSESSGGGAAPAVSAPSAPPPSSSGGTPSGD